MSEDELDQEKRVRDGLNGGTRNKCSKEVYGIQERLKTTRFSCNSCKNCSMVPLWRVRNTATRNGHGKHHLDLLFSEMALQCRQPGPKG